MSRSGLQMKLSSSLPSFSPYFERRGARGRADSEPKNLFALGEEITTKNAKGQSLIFYAIRFGHKGLAKELLEKGCDPNEADNANHYPIHEAVDQSETAMIELLKEYGADLNVKNLLGQTPLMRAVLFDDVLIVKTLLKAGADPYQRDISGQTLIEYALSSGRENTCLFLLQNGYESQTMDNIHLNHLTTSERSGTVVNSLINFLTNIKKKKGLVKNKIAEKTQNLTPLKVNLKFSKKYVLKKKNCIGPVKRDIDLPNFAILNIH
ncbi:putative ankyrin repeat protein RF_0381 [Saccostrea echinata]|uniref:putative ankyrin repeat protein RF_0381 n=1 Tax=Saccostrea echinata TaxID=191078 RepID=UPI002A7ED0E5|nr:putative ankyrin repeat protein RF_0381 [Saccostrea echinata]